MRARSRCLRLALAVALSAPMAAQAGVATTSPGEVPATAVNILTLYSEPGLKGRHATYRLAEADVERQGFVARSAASTGMWTLCEGGEVASRCQTVDGQAPELKFAPQLIRPGLNALALYDQPGLKGRRNIYSFAADRPAPFHARSARTWGGPWSLCERGFHRCQVLDGKSPSLDLVVGAVKPEAGSPDPKPLALPVKGRSIVAPKPIKPVALTSPKRQPLPIQAPAVRARTSPAQRPLRPQKLIHIAAPQKATPPHHLVIQLSDDLPLHRHHPSKTHDHFRGPAHVSHHSQLTPVRLRSAPRHDAVSHRTREVRLVREDHRARRAARARMMHMVSDHPSRRSHATHRRLYRRVRMFWGGGDPYLYDADPRDHGSEPW